MITGSRIGPIPMATASIGPLKDGVTPDPCQSWNFFRHRTPVALSTVAGVEDRPPHSNEPTTTIYL